MIGFMEPHRVSTTLILDTADAISSLEVQSFEVEEECCSPGTTRRLFLLGDDI